MRALVLLGCYACDHVSWMMLIWVCWTSDVVDGTNKPLVSWQKQVCDSILVCTLLRRGHECVISNKCTSHCTKLSGAKQLQGRKDVRQEVGCNSIRVYV